jgi:hypothetical protein
MATNETPEPNDLWEPFRYFLGSWTGTGTGKPGVSSTKRTYSLVLADRFLEIKSRSVYEPQESNPSGEVHEELGLISYDKTRARYVMREFHVEGYVNQYVLEPPAPGDKKLTFVTEAVENISSGWRARTTLEILSPDSFRETFELAGPGKEWACTITNELHRAL